MQQRILGKTGFQVSTLTLGGGGIGMVWGPTSEEACVETVKQAVAGDFALAQQHLGFLAAEISSSLAFAAMRYAFSLPGVSTGVTEAKNRTELAEAVAAAEAGPLPPALMERIATLQRTVLARP